ncbi:unnamed protein product [Ambrosiozyma monospora]|uniref:Unnamed protein product n=1 Tax=Ambrosiozyma monospora TaxID=43982 RepID=A0ACB5UBK1_AMBMO|nr:unnamed protein product [Ambrosiozyma monospora]
MLVKGSTDRDLCEILNDVGLGYLLERFGSLDYNPAFGGGSTNVSNKTDETSNGAVLANGSAGSSISNETNGKGIVIDEVMVNGEIVKVYNSNSGSTDGKQTWSTLLSGGERQKLVFARVLFHAKHFVLLDEPTSAISYDFEDMLFELLKKRGFTLITVSHRDSLLRYHDYLLHLSAG